MKTFVFKYVPIGGGTDSATIEASNQGVAIAQFKKQCLAVKILKIEKEKKKNDKEKK